MDLVAPTPSIYNAGFVTAGTNDTLIELALKLKETVSDEEDFMTYFVHCYPIYMTATELMTGLSDYFFADHEDAVQVARLSIYSRKIYIRGLRNTRKRILDLLHAWVDFRPEDWVTRDPGNPNALRARLAAMHEAASAIDGGLGSADYLELLLEIVDSLHVGVTRATVLPIFDTYGDGVDVADSGVASLITAMVGAPTSAATPEVVDVLVRVDLPGDPRVDLDPEVMTATDASFQFELEWTISSNMFSKDDVAVTLVGPGSLAFPLDATVLAKHFTFIEHSLFLAIAADELLFLGNDPSPTELADQAPNLAMALKFTDALERWIGTMVLIVAQSPEERRDMCRFFVDVARACLGLSNFSTARTIVLMLCNSQIDRLPFYETLEMDTWEDMRTMFLDFTFKRYLEAVDQVQVPLVPDMQALHILATKADMLNDTTVGDNQVSNFDKIRILGGLMDRFARHKKASYFGLSVHSEVIQFLLALGPRSATFDELRMASTAIKPRTRE